MRLHSIPPANRQRTGFRRLSTMRAGDETFTISASTPNPQAQRERQAFRQALEAKRQQLMNLLEDLLQSTDSFLLAEAELISEQLEKMQ